MPKRPKKSVSESNEKPKRLAQARSAKTEVNYWRLSSGDAAEAEEDNFSPSPSVSSVRSEVSYEENGLNDHELMDISIPQLNKFIRENNLTALESQKLRDRRRLLKNRIYSASGRHKHVDHVVGLTDVRQQYSDAIADLKTKNALLAQQLQRKKKQRDMLLLKIEKKKQKSNS